jgi:hypothetical protein
MQDYNFTELTQRTVVFFFLHVSRLGCELLKHYALRNGGEELKKLKLNSERTKSIEGTSCYTLL